MTPSASWCWLAVLVGGAGLAVWGVIASGAGWRLRLLAVLAGLAIAGGCLYLLAVVLGRV